MKTIKNWQAFNEMKADVYRRAADKAKDKYGRDYPKAAQELSNRFKEHADDMEHKNLADARHKSRKNKAKWNKFKPFKFESKKGDLKLVGRLRGIEFGMSITEFFENDGGIISLPAFFEFRQLNDRGNEINIKWNPDTKYSTQTSFIPFWINYQGSMDVWGPNGIEETPWEKYVGEGEDPILFDNKEDAERFIDELKNSEILKDELEYYKDEDGFESFMELYKEFLENIRPEHLCYNC